MNNGPGERNLRIDLDIVSDVVCPWCYIGKQRLERALTLTDPIVRVNIRWLPYELNPDMPEEGMDRDDYCVRKFGSMVRAQQIYDNVAANARADGLSLDYTRVQRIPNTRGAHKLIWYAERMGVQNAIVDALFRAYFVDARDVGRREVLLEIGSVAGLDCEGMQDVLDSDEAAEAVRDDEAQAHARGIQGVPAFLFNGRYVFSGAQTPQTIASVINQARRGII